jgi:hypothetical protein
MADTPMNEHTHPPEWWREQERIAGLTTAIALEPGEPCSHPTPAILAKGAAVPATQLHIRKIFLT